MTSLRAKLSALFLCLIAMLGGSVVLAAPAAAAASCYGDSCSGKDPSTTGVGGVPCANDARTVASSRVRVDYDQPGVYPPTRTEDIGYVELRWSARCQTNWARLVAERSSYVTQVWATQDTGYREYKYTRGWIGNTEPGTFWTNMIYSPVRRVSARVVCIGATPDGQCGWLNETAWV